MDSINIAKAEAHYGAKYIGYYDLPDREGPFSVFYQPNPQTDLGHSNYFGLFVHPVFQHLFITQAKSILEARYPAFRFPDGTILCSRYRHDYVTHDGLMLDGGLAYLRSGGKAGHGAEFGYIRIVGDHEEFFQEEPNV